MLNANPRKISLSLALYHGLSLSQGEPRIIFWSEVIMDMDELGFFIFMDEMEREDEEQEDEDDGDDF